MNKITIELQKRLTSYCSRNGEMKFCIEGLAQWFGVHQGAMEDTIFLTIADKPFPKSEMVKMINDEVDLGENGDGYIPMMTRHYLADKLGISKTNAEVYVFFEVYA